MGSTSRKAERLALKRETLWGEDLLFTPMPISFSPTLEHDPDWEKRLGLNEKLARVLASPPRQKLRDLSPL